MFVPDMLCIGTVRMVRHECHAASVQVSTRIDGVSQSCQARFRDSEMIREQFYFLSTELAWAREVDGSKAKQQGQRVVRPPILNSFEKLEANTSRFPKVMTNFREGPSASPVIVVKLRFRFRIQSLQIH